MEAKQKGGILGVWNKAYNWRNTRTCGVFGMLHIFLLLCVCIVVFARLIITGSSCATCQNEFHIYNDNEAIFMFNNFVSALKVNSMIFLDNIFFIQFLAIYELHENSHHLYFPRCYLLPFTLEQQNEEVSWRTINILCLFRNRSLTHD